MKRRDKGEDPKTPAPIWEQPKKSDEPGKGAPPGEPAGQPQGGEQPANPAPDVSGGTKPST